MSDKSTFEEAKAVVDRLQAELGLLVETTSSYLKVTGPANKHRVYISLSKNLGRIDTTVELAADDLAYKPLKSPLGSIRSHVTPTLEQLERVLRMLSDASVPTQVINKPKPFAPTRSMGKRTPKAVAAPVSLGDMPSTVVSEDDAVPAELQNRLKAIASRGRELRINRILENPEKYGAMSYDEAAELVDSKVNLTELEEARRNALNAELGEVIAEAGIEVT